MPVGAPGLPPDNDIAELRMNVCLCHEARINRVTQIAHDRSLAQHIDDDL